MEKKFSNAAESAAARPRASNGKKSSTCQEDDCSQLDNIIGGYGKYQFMIFMFKILIGLVWHAD